MVTLQAASWVHKAALALVLLTLQASAQGPEWKSFADIPLPRNLFVPKDPRAPVPHILVAGGVATTLRFETPCEPARTWLLGWEGRFEPLLVGGRSVVIVPLQGLAEGERFILQVTLVDGTSLPFTVTSSKHLVDGQVNVYPNPESPDAVRKALAEKKQENEALAAENQRQREEQTSVDHALAALLANGQLDLTPFKEHEVWKLHEDGIEMKVSVLVPKGAVPMKKAAVVFKLTNKGSAEPWELQEARLMTADTFQQPDFAVRMAPASIPPGATGHLAIVANLESLKANTAAPRLVLELFRNGGRRQAHLVFTPPNRR